MSPKISPDPADEPAPPASGSSPPPPSDAVPARNTPAGSDIASAATRAPPRNRSVFPFARGDGYYTRKAHARDGAGQAATCCTSAGASRHGGRFDGVRIRIPACGPPTASGCQCLDSRGGAPTSYHIGAAAWVVGGRHCILCGSLLVGGRG